MLGKGFSSSLNLRAVEKMKYPNWKVLASWKRVMMGRSNGWVEMRDGLGGGARKGGVLAFFESCSNRQVDSPTPFDLTVSRIFGEIVVRFARRSFSTLVVTFFSATPAHTQLLPVRGMGHSGLAYALFAVRLRVSVCLVHLRLHLLHSLLFVHDRSRGDGINPTHLFHLLPFFGDFHAVAVKPESLLNAYRQKNAVG